MYVNTPEKSEKNRNSKIAVPVLQGVENEKCVETARLNRVAECLYRNTGTGIFYVIVRRGGRQVKKSLKTNDKALAKRLAIDFRRRVGTLNVAMNAGKITFCELAQDWVFVSKSRLKKNSATRLEGMVQNLIACFGTYPVRTLTSAMCQQWEVRRSPEVSASTFNQEKNTLVRIFERAIGQGLLFENPAKQIKRRKPEKKQIVIPSHSQFCALVTAIRNAGLRSATGADLVELLAYSGMRLAEGTSMVWKDIDFERGVFHVTGGTYGTKNKEARTVPLFPALRAFLERLKKEHCPQLEEKVVSIRTARKAITNACTQANLPYFHHHTLRHYFISNAIEVGVDFKVIANWVGHKDGGVLVAKTYGHLRDSHSFEMAKRMTLNAHRLDASANYHGIPTSESDGLWQQASPDSNHLRVTKDGS